MGAGHSSSPPPTNPNAPIQTIIEPNGISINVARDNIFFTLTLVPGSHITFKGTAEKFNPFKPGTPSTDGENVWWTGFFNQNRHSQSYNFTHYRVKIGSDITGNSLDNNSWIFNRIKGFPGIDFNNIQNTFTVQNYNRKFPPGIYHIITETLYTAGTHTKTNTNSYHIAVPIPPILNSFQMYGPHYKNGSYNFTIHADFWGRDAPTFRFYSYSPYYEVGINYNTYNLIVEFTTENNNTISQNVIMTTNGNTSVGTLQLPNINLYNPVFLKAYPLYNNGNNEFYRDVVNSHAKNTVTAYLNKVSDINYSISYTGQNHKPVILFDQTQRVSFGETQLYMSIHPVPNISEQELRITFSYKYTIEFQGSYRVKSGFCFISKQEINQFPNDAYIADIERFLLNFEGTFPNEVTNTINQPVLSKVNIFDTNTLLNNSFFRFNSIIEPTLFVPIMSGTTNQIQLEEYNILLFVKLENINRNSEFNSVFTHNIQTRDFFTQNILTNFSSNVNTLNIINQYTIGPNNQNIPYNDIQTNNLLYTNVTINNKKTPAQTPFHIEYISPPISSETNSNVGSYYSNTYIGQTLSNTYIQNNKLELQVQSLLKIGYSNETNFFLTTSIFTKSINSILITPQINVSTIHNHPDLQKVNFTFKLLTYTDEIIFKLMKGSNIISQKTITPTNNIVNFNTGANTTGTVELGYTTTAFDGSELELEVVATNIIGLNPKTTIVKKDIGDELNAFPHLVSVDFIEITTIRYIFDISKDFFDDVINDTIHEGEFSFKPFNQTVAFKDVSKTVNGASYRITQEFPNQSLANNTAYSFTVNTVLHGDTTNYKSNSISKSFILNVPIVLNQVDFANPNLVQYEFEIPKAIIDDLINTSTNATFTFLPIGTNVELTDLESKVVNGTNYTISQTIDYLNHFTSGNTFTFQIKAEIERTSGIDYSSNSIPINYVLPTPSFEIESLPDIRGGIHNSIRVKNLSYPNGIFNTLIPEDITYTIQTKVPGYNGTQIFPYTANGSVTDISFIYYFADSVDVVVEFEYNGVAGATSHTEIKNNLGIIPFGITQIDIANIDENTREIDVKVNAYAPLEFYKLELKAIDPTTGGISDIDDATIEYTGSSSPDNYISSLANITNVEQTMESIPRTTTLTYGPDDIFDGLRVYANTLYKGINGPISDVSVNLTFTEIIDITAFLSNDAYPSFIDISFDVGTLNKDWKVPSNNGFVEIYEYRSASSFVIGEIPDASFTKIKRCQLYNAPEETKAIQSVAGKDNEYIINTFLEDRELINGWYYGYYLSIGLFNELGHELTRIDDTVRTFLHVDVIGNITSISAFISNPAFIDISFDVGENNEAWKLEQNKGFVDIYEYRSASSFVIGNIADASFAKIKRCELITTNDITKIQGVEGKDNEYVVNTYSLNRKIVHGWYYGYYLNIGLINEVNSELIRIDDTARSFVYVDYPLTNTYEFEFTTNIGNGFIGSGEHTIPIFGNVFTPNPVPSVPFYDFDHDDLVYTTTYDHRGTSNVRSIVYTTESNPSTSLGEFPTNIGELEYVDDTSRVQVSITMNYRINGIHDDISNIPTRVQDVDTLIEPKPVTNLNVQKTITNNISGIHIQWNHTGIVEDFLVSIVDVTINPPVVDASYVFSGRYVIGTDDYETTYTYEFDISYGIELLDKEISFNVTPRFYGVHGETKSIAESFIFEAVDISFTVNYPTLITFDFSINGIQQEEATENIAVLIGVSDNDIPNPLRIDENDVFALFRNPDDTEPRKRLLQTFYPYPQPDASNVLTSGRMLDLSYGFGVPLDPGKYYYFTVCPVVDVPERGGLFISPPSNVAKIQLRDISGIDISLVFHQSYTQEYTLGGTDFSANAELARFGITDPTNILEIKYTTWNGWPENLVINIAENGVLDFSESSSYTIPGRRVYTDVSFEAFTEAPRYQGFEIQEIYNYEDLLSQGDYFSENLTFVRDASGIQKLIDISNIHTDVSNTYYTLSDHVLVRHVDTPNVSVEIIQEIEQFGTNTFAEETIPTPVRPNDISLGQFYAHNLWTVDETRRLHIYLQNYDVGGLDLNELEFRVTVYDTSLGQHLAWTEDSGVVLNDYSITIDSDISFVINGFIEDIIPVFSFDVSYDGEEETDNVDISIVAVYYGVENTIIERDLVLLSTKPIVDVSSVPNPTTNPSQDPKEIAIDLSFSATDPVLAVNMRVFVSDISIVDYENSGVLPDASFVEWLSVSGERLERTGTNTFGFTTYNPNQGLREFTWMYFQFQGVYGRTTTTWSDTYEFVIDELLERPQIDISFMGYTLPYFAIDLVNVIGETENIQDIYPYNRLLVDISDISFSTLYTFDFHYTNNVFELDVSSLPYANFYTADSIAVIDITPRYANIVLGESATQTVSAETLIVPIIDTGEVELGSRTGGKILINWNPIPFAIGYRVYRSVYQSPVLEPEDISFQLLATIPDVSTDKYFDTLIRTNEGELLRFNPYVYYGIQAIYSISGEVVYSDISPIVYFAFDIGCVCPLSSPVLKFNSSGVIRQISNRRRIAQKLATGRKYF